MRSIGMFEFYKYYIFFAALHSWILDNQRSMRSDWSIGCVSVKYYGGRDGALVTPARIGAKF